MSDKLAFVDLAVPGVRGLRPYEPGKPESELARELGLRPEDIVKLASNENPLGPSPRAVAAVQEALGEIARYPDGNGFDLKHRLSEHHGVAPQQITLGNGSNDVLEIIARTFVRPEDGVVFSEHAFIVYPLVTQAIGATPQVAAARDYGHDLEALRGKVDTSTRIVFIANPNNPTGTWLRAGELEAFVADLPRTVLVVVDEAYIEYVDDPDFPDASKWIGRYPNLIVTRTFSKVHGLAGLRIGYALSQPETADLLNRVRQPFNVNSLAQAAACGSLGDPDHVRRGVELNRKGMDALTSAFEELGLAWIPSVGNFVTVDLGKPADGVFRALLHEGVIVRPIAGYGLPNHLRITIGTSTENARCVAALRKVLAAG
ncbi:MAG: histidinol-phosphate transaminase [Gammaproteobacteria bacterium]|nr:histidinol-phosphate transaminase [Gammaproteobacteria bacterium]